MQLRHSDTAGKSGQPWRGVVAAWGKLCRENCERQTAPSSGWRLDGYVSASSVSVKPRARASSGVRPLLRVRLTAGTEVGVTSKDNCNSQVFLFNSVKRISHSFTRQDVTTIMPVCCWEWLLIFSLWLLLKNTLSKHVTPHFHLKLTSHMISLFHAKKRHFLIHHIDTSEKHDSIRTS